MSKKLIKNSIYYTIGNILPQAASFFLLPVYTIYLSPSEYGIVNAMTVLGGILGVILTLGIENGVYRLYYDYGSEEKKIFLGSLIMGLSALSLLFCGLLISFPQLSEQIYKSIPFYPYYVITIIITLCSKITIVPNIYLRVNEQAGVFVTLNLLSFFSRSVLNLFFIIYLNEGAIGMLKASLISELINIPLFFYYSLDSITWKFNLSYIINTLKFTLPFIPGLLFAWIINLSDRIFLEKYTSLHEVGIYSFGYRIASIITVIVGGIYSAYNPHFYKLANEQGAVAKITLQKINNVLISVILSFCFVVSLYCNETFKIFISKDYEGAVSVIPVLSLAFFFSLSSGLLNLMIYQEKKSLQLMLIGFLGAGVNLVSNYLFVSWLGILGAALASVVTFSLLFLMTYVYAKKCYFIPFAWSTAIGLLLTFSLVIGFFHLVFIESLLFSLLVKTAIVFVVYYFLFKKNDTFSQIGGMIRNSYLNSTPK